MSDDIPFQMAPPPPPEGEPEKGSSSAALIGIFIGFFLGLILPVLTVGVLAGIFASLGLPAWFQVLVPLAAGVGGPIMAFRAVTSRLDTGRPDDMTKRRSVVVSGYTALGLWAVGFLLVGVCVALLVGAY